VRDLIAFLSLVVLVTLFGGRHLRPSVIGISLISCGFAVHAAFDLWVADFAGRIEMGGFAIIEGLLILAGLALVAASLAAPRPTSERPITRVSAWFL
jgi:hypothetical protein